MTLSRFLPSVWACLAFLTQLAAVEITRGPSVESTGTNAVIRWTTDVPTGTRVSFGLRPNSMNSRVEGPLGADHVVTLTGLHPGSTYHYTVGTARYTLATNSFTTLGTLPSGAVGAAPAESTKPAPGRPAPEEPQKVPPTRKIWGNMGSLQDHFDRHGRDFNAKDPEDYAAQAWRFLQRARAEGLPAKRDSEGVLRVYDPKSRAFAAYNRDGTAKTYFKPGRRNYFEDQPGDTVDLKSER